jgi:hypothetical protein
MKQQTRKCPSSSYMRRNSKKDAPFKYPGAKLARKAMEGKLTLRG